MIPRYSRPEMNAIWSENNAFELWLQVEIAASQAWTDEGVVPAEDMVKIKNAKFDRAAYDRWFDETKHDIVSFTRAVGESLGDEKRWVHHGLTSNDVKDTALSMQLTQSCDLLDKGLVELLNALRVQAINYKDTPCIGRSHGIHAEPMSFGMKLALWFAEMNRNRDRLASARTRVAVGMLSGPVGTFASVPPVIEESVCEQLNLSPAEVSNQVIQRDRHAEYVQVLALIAATLDKMATEIRGLQRTEVREVEEPFGKPGYVTKGSSSMPHKRNPELSERICGLARLIRGHSITALENVALWHERDISHSSAERMILPDASLGLDYIMSLMTGIIKDMVVHEDRMMQNLESTRGLVFSPRVMLLLVEHGVDRDAAYDAVQRNSMRSWDEELDFRELIKTDPAVSEKVSAEALDDLFDYNFYLGHVDHIYKRVGISEDAIA
ncbi:MAG: adenylosuccinate lyase [Chloroflexi bacterium]|nr:adenylosuccinate lyase [Chloroflexota bacterium]MBT5627676.1 adenylosuccinate lyase [Chloroflexota bacterium]